MIISMSSDTFAKGSRQLKRCWVTEVFVQGETEWSFRLIPSLTQSHTKLHTETVREEVILAKEGISLKDNSVSSCIWYLVSSYKLSYIELYLLDKKQAQVPGYSICIVYWSYIYFRKYCTVTKLQTILYIVGNIQGISDKCTAAFKFGCRVIFRSIYLSKSCRKKTFILY